MKRTMLAEEQIIEVLALPRTRQADAEWLRRGH